MLASLFCLNDFGGFNIERETDSRTLQQDRASPLRKAILYSDARAFVEATEVCVI